MRDAVRGVIDGGVEVEEGPRSFSARPSGAERRLRQDRERPERRDEAAHSDCVAALLPTFILGLYGRNFVDVPELRRHLGHAHVWGLIGVTTAFQLWWFRRERWL